MPQTSASVDVPDELLQQAKKMNLCPFLGAGFSKNIDPEIPSARDLNALAAQCLGMEADLLDAQSNGDYQLVAEYLLAEGRFEDAVRLIDRALHRDTFRVNRSEPHVLLTKMKFPAIFTTNWDSWIEAAFHEMNVELPVVRTPSDYGKAVSSGSPPLFKLHGDISIPDSFVYSITSYYERMTKPSPFDIWLSEAIFHRSFLFIGYSFYDPNLRFIWYKIKYLLEASRLEDKNLQLPTSFLISNTSNKLMRSWLSQIGIEVIVIDSQKSNISDAISSILLKVRQSLSGLR